MGSSNCLITAASPGQVPGMDPARHSSGFRAICRLQRLRLNRRPFHTLELRRRLRLSGTLLSYCRKQDPLEAKIASITTRERAVIRLVGEGLNARQIAERLFISETTVHHHLTSIYSKLEVVGRLELMIFAY